MEVNEKINRAAELFAERARIEAEIRGLFGDEQIEVAGTVRIDKKNVDAVMRGGKRKGGRACSNCGEPGHTRVTCGRQDEKNKTASGAMNKHDFELCKERQKEGKSALDIAGEIGCDLKEVNIAFTASAFMSYIRNRKSEFHGQ